MPRTKKEMALHLAFLSACFGVPLMLETTPDWVALCVNFALALLAWFSTVQSDDPFLSTERVTALSALVYTNAVAYSLSGRPAQPAPGWESAAVALVYLATLIFAIVRASRRVEDIDLEYFQYSLPSKRLNVDLGRRTGRLDQAQAALRLQLFVKEGLQFRRLSQVCRLLVLQCWGGLALFAVLGLREPWHLLAFLATSLVVSASATSIASRATLHPGRSLDNDWVDEDDDDELDERSEEEDDPGEYRPRRRR